VIVLVVAKLKKKKEGGGGEEEWSCETRETRETRERESVTTVKATISFSSSLCLSRNFSTVGSMR